MPDLMLDSLSGQESMWGLLIINSMTQTDKTIVGGPAVQLFALAFWAVFFACLIGNLIVCKSLLGYKHYEHNLPCTIIQLSDSFHENLLRTYSLTR